jgi:hypothetical protein
MTTQNLLDRIRAADPATGETILPDPALMAAILATPGDPRLDDAPRPSRVSRRAALVIAALAVCVGTAWAAGGSSPLELFQSNPQDDGVPGSLWHQKVIDSTVHRVTDITIPSVGKVQLWYAESAQHGWCGALRLPGGGWVARNGGPLDGGGAVPGCQPTRRQVNGAGEPVFVLNGFDYVEGDVDARAQGHGFWRITYGIVEGRHRPVHVLDRVSGRSTPVREGRLFALAIRDPDPSKSRPMRLVALAADGSVVAAEQPAGR